ncbi:MAG TPA: molybdopterin-guanine dinucleotide biosynthesis protein B [Candidatus Competibacteraceae bacterium]|nr:molybdopterin-guanine dinucleotide biosynthesis protein B [Candidatus Competibacteraceae bacterium]
MHSPSTPVLGFAAYSGTGKTTLLRLVIPLLRARGLRLGLLKHSHHSFEIDHPSKDSYRLRQAGASQVLVTSSRRTVLMSRSLAHGDESLPQLLARLDSVELDLILVEGFKRQPIPKIELHRPNLGLPLLCRQDRHIIAVASDAPPPPDIALPWLDLNAPPLVVDFILTWWRSQPHR